MQSFRQAMAWLHTWFGLVLGFVLMAAFFFGALSVFDREIDRWAIPSTRFEPQPMPSYEKILRPAFERMQPLPATVGAMRPRVNGPMPERFDTVVSWSAYTTHRDPVLQLFAGYEVPNAKDPEEAIWADATIDPRDGTPLPNDRLKVGSGFFYPMHYGLTLDWKNLGIWIVGFSALMMLVAEGAFVEVRPNGTLSLLKLVPAIIILSREILVSGLREYLAELKVSVPVTRIAKWKTTIQMFAIGFLLAGPAGDKVLPYTTELGIALLWIAAAITMYTGYDYFRAGLKHIVDER